MKVKKTVADNPKLLAEWHPTKNGDLKPEDVTHGSQKIIIWWKCPVADDHVWEATAAYRSRNNCPCCSGRKPCLDNCFATVYITYGSKKKGSSGVMKKSNKLLIDRVNR